MKRPPCIRGLSEFRKGCPQRTWDGESGCPAWIDRTLPKKGGTEMVRIHECLDLFTMRLRYDANALLEGNQQAIEMFRNNMTVPGSPKPDPALSRFVQLLEESNRGRLALDVG